VALDRDSIVRRDFPTNRRGYDPAAVEAHLTALAGEVEALQDRASEPTTLSAQAGEQVRAIVQAAERGAEEIRATANAEAAERVASVTEAAEHLRARVEQMEADVTHVMSSLRDEARRLRDDLEALSVDAGRLGAASEGEGEPAPEAASPTAEPAREEDAAPSPDAAAARIVALDMALSGAPRDETERFLAENYDVGDRAALLDEVYAAAGG
jgi:cell division septum initiation protein DivIVA